MIKYTINEQRIATLTLNRDDKRNAFSGELAQQILRSLADAESNGVRVLILRANPGVKVWCAGHDLAELDLAKLDTENAIIEVAKKIQSVPFPVVAMVEGSVHGGGLLLLLSADIVIAAENAEVAITSNKLGIPLSPELHAYWLRVMGLHKAKELLFTAATITALDAYHAGLYNHVVDQGRLEQVTNEIALRIIECSPAAVANSKYQLNLLAQQSSLGELDAVDVRERGADILNSDDTRSRIERLLASLRRPGI